MPRSATPGPLCQESRPQWVEDGTMCRAPSPRPGSIGSTAHPVGAWDLRDKLVEAMRRTAPKLPADMRDQFLALLSAENLAITGGVLVAWAGSHAFGVGEAVDVVLLGVGAFTIGWQVGRAASDLADFFEIAAGAQTESDLDRAADHLARFVAVVGVTVVVALIARAASRLRLRPKAAPQAEPTPIAETPPPPPETLPAVVPAEGAGAPFSDVPSFRDKSIKEILAWLRSHGFEEVQKPVVDPMGKTKSSHIWFRRSIQPDGTGVIEAVRIDARGNAVGPSIPREGTVPHRFADEPVAYSEPRHLHKELIDDSMIDAYLRKKGARYPGKSRPIPYSDENVPNRINDHKANHIWVIP